MKKPLPIGVDNYNKREESAYVKKALPIGIENFKEIIEKNAYYVDKTMVLKDLIDSASKVTLFTRPRRFGKTLLQSMFRTFFEKEIGIYGDNVGKVIDNHHYFDGMKIMQVGEKYSSLQGQFPVITLSLKSAKQPNFEESYKNLANEIQYEFKRHQYILLNNEDISEDEKEKYKKIMTGKADYTDNTIAIKFLSYCLEKYFHKKVIILIDEYDVPLENAYFHGFYEQMIGFICSLFESALKTNESLEMAVITGCLRISKESIFTGLNNLKINSILSNGYGEYFGFVQEEINDMLAYYDMTEKTDEVRTWYNGYLFGNAQVYNPWSVVNYVDDQNEFPKPYWSNTSSNSIVRDLIERADDVQKGEIENLIAGGSITIPVHEDITYDEIYNSEDNLWNFLFFTGYLKAKEKQFDGQSIHITLEIPNAEVCYIYKNTILTWFEQKIKKTDRSRLFESLIQGDEETFAEELQELLMETISFYDYAENFYHGFIAGVLTGMKGYIIKSNRESGKGRSDIFVYPLSRRKEAFVLEFKMAKSIAELEGKAEEAIQQIIDKKYENGLKELGFTKIKRYGIAFFGKDCLVISK